MDSFSIRSLISGAILIAGLYFALRVERPQHNVELLTPKIFIVSLVRKQSLCAMVTIASPGDVAEIKSNTRGR